MTAGEWGVFIKTSPHRASVVSANCRIGLRKWILRTALYRLAGYNSDNCFQDKMIMPDKPTTSVDQEKKQRLLTIFERLLPLVDNLANKLRLTLLLGILSTLWLVAWFYFLKHFSIGISAAAGTAAVLPSLILARFWWALEELKNLPDIANQMMGDAKTELQDSLLNLQSGKLPKLGFFSVGKNLWSIGAMGAEAKELLGSYIGITTLVNPVMLVLGVISFICVFLLFFIGIVLALFI